MRAGRDGIAQRLPMATPANLALLDADLSIDTQVSPSDPGGRAR